MRLFIFFFIAFICKQGSGTTYHCNTTASCGCSTSSTVVIRIIGGETAAQGSWSWTVSLRDDGEHICGGSILSPLFIAEVQNLPACATGRSGKFFYFCENLPYY